MNVMYNKTNKAHIYYVYILANKRNGTLYIGITNDLFNRKKQRGSTSKLEVEPPQARIEKDNPTWRDLFFDML